MPAKGGRVTGTGNKLSFETDCLHETYHGFLMVMTIIILK